MSILNILTVGNDSESLSETADDLTKEDILSSKIQTLIEDMKDTCHSVGGLGLAANQVGAPANLFIYSSDVGRNTMTHQYDVIINPVIFTGYGALKFKSKGEGCLSVPKRYFTVVRQKQIVIMGLNEKAEEVKFRTKSKQLARILQHEFDHLHGVTIADKGKETT